MNIDAFILIGGRSSRLGTDKAFAELGGETLAVRAARTVETALSSQRITFVAGDKTQFNTDLVFGLGHAVVFDLKPGFGAWSGLETALGYARSEWIFVLACDLPMISAELLQLLSACVDENLDAVVPCQSDGRMQPLCAFYKVRPIRSVVERMFTGESTVPPLAAIFDEIDARIVGDDEYGHLPAVDKFFLNVNTPADLKGAEQGCLDI